MLNRCERKLVEVTQGKNAAADFFLATEVPVAAHVVGMILNDLANEFDPNNPNFGEKFAPSWVPVSFRDYTGKEELSASIRTNTERTTLWCRRPTPSMCPVPAAWRPNMLIACMNDPGPIPDPANPGQHDHRPAVQAPIHSVLLHLPVHAGRDHLPGYPRPADGRLRGPESVSSGLRISGWHPDHSLRDRAWQQRTLCCPRRYPDRHLLGRGPASAQPRLRWDRTARTSFGTTVLEANVPAGSPSAVSPSPSSTGLPGSSPPPYQRA